ncbi:MAG: alpha/beta hydrolase [Flavobacteriaceae bacterium]|nr:alpha/beta hydrolase [Flavobacteriaceae bacterium]
MTHHFLKANGIVLHYLEKNNNLKPVVILLHGLSANANSFESYMALIDNFRVISVDLRGRGLSDKPNGDYSIQSHAKDIIDMMDVLKIDKAILAGHSFGGLLSIYLAVHFSNRVLKIILIDVAAKMHPKVREMVTPSMSRLKKTWKSYDEYMINMKKAPFLKGEWLPEMESFYKADCKETENGIEPRSNFEDMQQAIEAVLNPDIHWEELITQIKQPSIVINGNEPFVDNLVLVSKENALETVEMIQNCTYVEVAGNHVTMLFGKGAKQTVNAITNFIN